MVGLVCERCPLAFEVGYYGYWDLSGGCVKYICRHCGTMHKIEHLQCQEDILFALDGPIRAMVEEPWVTPDGETQSESHLPVTEDSWRMIGTLPTAIEFLQGWFILPVRAQAVALDRVTCAHCGCVGGLLSREWPLKADGTKPELEDNCPVCGEHLKWLYLHTIN